MSDPHFGRSFARSSGSQTGAVDMADACMSPPHSPSHDSSEHYDFDLSHADTQRWRSMPVGDRLASAVGEDYDFEHEALAAHKKLVAVEHPRAAVEFGAHGRGAEVKASGVSPYLVPGSSSSAPHKPRRSAPAPVPAEYASALSPHHFVAVRPSAKALQASLLVAANSAGATPELSGPWRWTLTSPQQQSQVHVFSHAPGQYLVELQLLSGGHRAFLAFVKTLCTKLGGEMPAQEESAPVDLEAAQKETMESVGAGGGRSSSPTSVLRAITGSLSKIVHMAQYAAAEERASAMAALAKMCRIPRCCRDVVAKEGLQVAQLYLCAYSNGLAAATPDVTASAASVMLSACSHEDYRAAIVANKGLLAAMVNIAATAVSGKAAEVRYSCVAVLAALHKDTATRSQLGDAATKVLVDIASDGEAPLRSLLTSTLPRGGSPVPSPPTSPVRPPAGKPASYPESALHLVVAKTAGQLHSEVRSSLAARAVSSEFCVTKHGTWLWRCTALRGEAAGLQFSVTVFAQEDARLFVDFHLTQGDAFAFRELVKGLRGALLCPPPRK